MNLMVGRHLGGLPGPILITGHTGFKGTWLTLLLEFLGIPTVGLALLPEKGSLFDRAERMGAIPEAFLDVRNAQAVSEFVAKCQPSVIFHMAAQPLVLESYKSPNLTFETNLMGTVNILDAAFKSPTVKAVVVITTDKVYHNDNSGKPFVETDPLSGKDPYSASKVATEAAVSAWQQIARMSGGPKVISVRAGNVIGGGDWAKDRLIPDLIRGFQSGEPIQIRNPKSIRPWQHVLDPLSGYISALEANLSGNEFSAMNFGPEDESVTVEEVVRTAAAIWPEKIEVDFTGEVSALTLEAVNLQLNSNYAFNTLGWKPVWDQKNSINRTIEWWNKHLNMQLHARQACREDISDFLGEKVD
jgi:CDP-glucose 4,6-dehydratase